MVFTSSLRRQPSLSALALASNQFVDDVGDYVIAARFGSACAVLAVDDHRGHALDAVAASQVLRNANFLVDFERLPGSVELIRTYTESFEQSASRLFVRQAITALLDLLEHGSVECLSVREYTVTSQHVLGKENAGMQFVYGIPDNRDTYIAH